jgi:lysine-N-methylase
LLWTAPAARGKPRKQYNGGIMSMPVHHLPVVQNWDCHGCGNCCREYEIPVTPAERERIVAQGWHQDPAVGDLPLFVKRHRWSSEYSLFRTDRGCVFLSPEGRCRLHERFGPQAKPFACRLYPFVLVPAGEHWRVSLRFACPSAATNQGRALNEHTGDIQQLAALLERNEQLQGRPLPPPFLQRGQSVAWADLLRFVHVLVAQLRGPEERQPLQQRWRRCLALVALCRRARFDKITGNRLTEFLQVVSSGLEAEVATAPAELSPPGWMGRMFFRQMLAVFARRDRGDLRGPDARTRWRRFRAGWRFARGKGRVPRVNALLPETTFQEVELATGPLPQAAEDILQRYYIVKLGSLQFFGSSCFGLPFWDGVEALAATLPPLLWLARAFAECSREEAVTQAVQLVDDHFGYNRVLGSSRYRWMIRTLAEHGELARLIAWYSR